MSKKRTAIAAAAAVVAIALGVTGFLLMNGAGADESAHSVSPTVETATVTKTDLVERVETKGTLNHGKPATYGTQLTGTLTSVAAPGTKLSIGTEMMRVNERPVFSMRGEVPAWRNFEEGMSNGRDVMQLEQNLQALGYFDDEPDEHYGWLTASAVAQWQKDNGFEWSTTLELGRVVFIPGDVQVSAQQAKAGDPASTTVLEVTGTSKVVTTEVPPSMRSLLPVGAKVDVKLPDGQVTQAVVESVEPPVEKEDKSGQKSVKVPVQLSLTDPAAAEAYSDVTVSVVTTRTTATDVLAVPVRALLAEPGGKYAVEVIKNNEVTRVQVEPGAFADDLVEIKSGDLHEGDKVAVSE
ncbi:peptidoglycan-binding protein [uncultured Gulosibacter sp.]|uniref:peptidoglycan-binding protein n=1 Tax=uncultured Gulosibacter sp. TaxID=1339167 RepID=UPI00288AF974|nr:peptidoglycan-binding protein [uncultured Gulosibacter sp.]